ncbi:MAG: VWA domain-containing protein [Vicinamibacterales bacterium]
MTRRCVLVVLAAMMALAPGPHAQVFRAVADAVPVDVLVTRGGAPVDGLSADNFELRDNGVAQEILSTRLEDVPLTLMLVLDVSGSVAGQPLTDLQAAIDAAAGALSAQDQLALITFSNDLTLEARATNRFADVRTAARQIEARGATALYDATMAALAMRTQVDGRALVLLFSDGADTVSWIDPRTVLDSARRSDVVVYGVARRDQTARESAAAVRRLGQERLWFLQDPWSYGRQFLPLLAEATGGALLTAERTNQLRETFVRAVREFKSRYVLLYRPQGVAPGGFHDIDVRLKGTSGDVQARRGYLRGQ